MKNKIINFIKQNKTPYLLLNCSLNEDNKKKYKGLVKGYNTFSYIKSKEQAKIINFEPNHVLIKVPSDVIIIDTDAKASYNKLIKYLSANNLYNEANTTNSFSGKHLNLNYKKHFYFKCFPSEKKDDDDNYINGVTHLKDIDIYNNSWGIGENLDSIINYDELQYLTIKQTNDILKLFKHKPKIIKPPSEVSTETPSETETETETETATSVDDNILNEILNNLDPERFNNYGLDVGVYGGGWFKLACIFINEKFNIEILERASMNSSKYNKRNNQAIYNYIRRNTYNRKPATYASLVNMLKKDNPPIYEKIFLKDVEFIDFTESDKLDLRAFEEVKTINNKFLYTTDTDVTNIFNYQNFRNNDTLIIESATGTGKTTAVAHHLYEYIMGEYVEHTHLKFLSITPRQILSEQHINSFKDVNCISYKNKRNEKQDNKILWDAKAVSMCVNSILTYSKFNIQEFKNYVIYIDEINSFLNYLTHSTTLDSNLKEVYEILKRMVNNCNKLIVSDAQIMNNVILFLQNRKGNKFYIKNNYKKYEGVNAFHYKDENQFLNKLKENIKTNQYFFMGCDSKQVTKKYLLECKKIASEEQKNNFIEITADTNFKLTNATEQFKNKFVFYSPKMIYGVDFNNIDINQDVFIYIKGHTINPSESFQQATRVRNIKNLYFYGVDKNKNVRFKTLDEVENFYKNNIELSQKLNLVSRYLNERDEEIIFESSFFKLYCFNEYIRQVYKSNKVRHFINILKSFGFNVETVGQAKPLDKIKNKLMLITLEKIEDEFINKYIEDDNKDKAEYEQLNKRRELLNLSTVEETKAYSMYLSDGKLIEQHFNRINFLRTDEQINQKFNISQEKNYKVKTINNIYHKIKLIRQLESTYNINIVDGFINNNTTNINFDDNLYKLISGVFKTKTKKPKKFDELIKLYVSMVKHIDEKLIISNQIKTKENRDKYNYSLSYKLLYDDLKLNQLRKPDLIHIKNRDNILINCNETTKDPIIINIEDDNINNYSDNYDFIDNSINVAASIEEIKPAIETDDEPDIFITEEPRHIPHDEQNKQIQLMEMYIKQFYLIEKAKIDEYNNK